MDDDADDALSLLTASLRGQQLLQDVLAEHERPGQVEAALVGAALEVHLDPALPVQVASPLPARQGELKTDSQSLNGLYR